MKNPKITINRLAIRLQGIDADLARAAVAGLGEELLVKLAEQQSLFTTGEIIDIESINLSNIKYTKEQQSHQLRSAIASALTGEIVQRVRGSKIVETGHVTSAGE